MASSTVKFNTSKMFYYPLVSKISDLNFFPLCFAWSETSGMNCISIKFVPSPYNFFHIINIK